MNETENSLAVEVTPAKAAFVEPEIEVGDVPAVTTQGGGGTITSFSATP